MELTISITLLNDFVFCPLSIYFHSLDSETESILYQKNHQINGKFVHSSIDNKFYSHKKDILQGISVYSSKYNVYGKIDIFDVEKGELVERKKHVRHIYDGYIYQLYAEYYGLVEMGYQVKSMKIYSYDDNKTYPIAIPSKDRNMKIKFEETIKKIKEIDIGEYKQTNVSKCQECIYEPLCFGSLIKE